jgi:Tfp pilus assembly protein FimV
VRALSKDEIKEAMEEEMSDTNKAVSKATHELDAASEELRAAQQKVIKARQTLHDEIAAQPHTPASPVQHPGRVVIEPFTGYRDPVNRWNGPNTDIRARQPLTPKQLDDLRANSQTKPQPTFAERAEAAKRAGVPLAPPKTLILSTK